VSHFKRPIGKDILSRRNDDCAHISEEVFNSPDGEVKTQLLAYLVPYIEIGMIVSRCGS
jgi:hypothetical protein